MAQDIATAYAMKRRNQMAQGGMVENEKLHPMAKNVIDHPDAKEIVAQIMAKKMCEGGMPMADGGMAEMETYSDSADDLFTGDHEGDEDEMAMGGMVDKKKKRLSDIMSRY